MKQINPRSSEFGLAGRLISKRDHFEKAAYSGGPYLPIEIEVSDGVSLFNVG